MGSNDATVVCPYHNPGNDASHLPCLLITTLTLRTTTAMSMLSGYEYTAALILWSIVGLDSGEQLLL